MASETMLKLIFFGLIILATALEITGDIFFKKWSINGKSAILIIGFIIYTLGTIFWALSIKYGDLSKAISLLTILNLIVVVLVGVLYFNENLTLTNKIGICLGVVSIILIEI